MAEFDFSEFERFAENWERSVNQFEPFLKQFLLETAQRVIAKTKPRTPVDTGALRALWDIGEIRGSGANIEVEIVNPADYASFVEYGARNVNGSWREGRFMLTLSLDEIQRQMPERFHKQFRQWLINRGMA